MCLGDGPRESCTGLLPTWQDDAGTVWAAAVGGADPQDASDEQADRCLQVDGEGAG